MRTLTFLISIWIAIGCTNIEGQKSTENSNPKIYHRGTVKEVHRQGDFSTHVSLDTLAPQNLYAIGPGTGLDGEFFIMGDRGFVYRLDTAKGNTYTDKSWRDEEAAFLVWSYVESWDTIEISDTPIHDIAQLEKLIAQKAELQGLDTGGAFPFLAHIPFTNGLGHVMSREMRLNSENKGHSDAKFVFDWEHQPAQLLGFFSPNHAGVFTHHGVRVHIHFRLGNKYQGGHLDEITIAPSDWKLLLPSPQNPEM